MISVSVPFPPSLSQCFNNVRGRGRVPSKRYVAWQEEAGWMVKAARPTPVAGDVSVELVIGRPDRRRRDLDNLAKPLLDLLVKHRLIEDDSRIVELRMAWGLVDGAQITVAAA